MNTPGENLYIVPFGHAFLALTTEEFQAALERGSALAGSAAAPPGGNGDGSEKLLTASEISAATPGIPAAWYLAHARQGLIPYVKLGKYIRFRLGKVVEHGAVTAPAEPGGKWSRQKDKRVAP